MSTTHAPEPAGSAAGTTADRPRGRRARVVWFSALGVIGGALLLGAVVVFGWMIDETHFTRHDARFDALVQQIDALPEVLTVESERWVEAPTFSDPTSWIGLTVDADGLPSLIEAACASDYPDVVTWSVNVRSAAGSEISLNGSGAASDAAAESGCLDFGFDGVRLVEKIDDVAPGLAVSPMVMDNGAFTLVSLDESAGFSHLLPLVARSGELREAAGLEADRPVEINAFALGVRIEPDETAEYLGLLTRLADDHGVTNFWETDAAAQTDGVAKVQLTAPEREHAAIEKVIRASGLRIGDFEVRFLSH